MGFDVEELDDWNLTKTPVANRLIGELDAPIVIASDTLGVVFVPVYTLLKRKVLLPDSRRAATTKQAPE